MSYLRNNCTEEHPRTQPAPAPTLAPDFRQSVAMLWKERTCFGDPHHSWIVPTAYFDSKSSELLLNTKCDYDVDQVGTSVTKMLSDDARKFSYNVKESSLQLVKQEDSSYPYSHISKVAYVAKMNRPQFVQRVPPPKVISKGTLCRARIAFDRGVQRAWEMT
jgi:hypothetical protein